jgi:hypothetical protein
MNWLWHARSSRTRRSHLLTRQRPRRGLEISTAQSLRAFRWPIPPGRALSFWRPKGLANPVTTGRWQMFAKSAWRPRMQPCPWHSEMQWTGANSACIGQQSPRLVRPAETPLRTYLRISTPTFPCCIRRFCATSSWEKQTICDTGATPRASNFRGPPMAPCLDPRRSPRQSKQSKQITDAYSKCDIKRGRDYSVARIGAFCFPATEVD